MITIDARQLEPPEPFERVIDALGKLAPGDQVLLILDREPRPLYRFLSSNNYGYQATWTEDGACEVRIWETAGSEG
jgi:uncharacterized protein (DUF2249 family)